MNQPVSVGSRFGEWWFVLLVVIAICLVVAGPILMLVGFGLGLPILGAGAVLTLLAVASGVTIAVRRCDVWMTPEGFVVRDRHGERAFTPEQVICASLTHKPNYLNGELKSTTRTFDVWVDGEEGVVPERIKMVNKLPLGTYDQLSPLLERILDHIHERANAALANRQVFEGEGWTLHRNELAVQGRTATSVRLDELAAVDIFDNALCVWKHFEDRPVLRIPMSSANVPVLLRLLRDRIPAGPDGVGPPPGDQLGRILFERGPGPTDVALIRFMPIVLVLVIAGAIALAAIQRDLTAALIGMALVFGLGLFWVIPCMQAAVFRCHEFGICRKWFRWETRLRFVDVETFTYSAIPRYVKGVYSGTNFVLTFEARTGDKPTRLSYAKTLRNADLALNHLRDHVSMTIAERMEDEYSQGETVTWSGGLRFTSAGLEYRAAGLFRRKPPIIIPYDQIHGYDANQRMFQLWVHGRKKPLVKESTAQPNFYPGYFLLARLVPTHEAETPAAT